MPNMTGSPQTTWEAPERRRRWRAPVVVLVLVLLLVVAAVAMGLVADTGSGDGQLAVERPGDGSETESEDGGTGLAGSRPQQGEGWRQLSSSPLTPRFGAVSVWTGEEWLVVGGRKGSTLLASGARYEPDADQWGPVAEAPEPLWSELQKATWTGSELLVWGRSAEEGQLGLAYDPEADRWESLPDAPLRPRDGHGLAWVGEELIVWGGSADDGPLGDGAAYDPGTGEWRRLPEAPLPAGDPLVATAGDDRLLVWSQEGPPYGDGPMRGAVYLPGRDRWRPAGSTEAPVGGPSAATAVWTGDRAIVCCDSDADVALGLYDPATDEWSRRAAPGTVADRMLHTAVWTGETMLVWGGRQDAAVWLRGNGAEYEPTRRAWSPVPEADPRMPRMGHVAAWTGEELLIWGGFDNRRARGDGAAFRP